MVEEISVLKIFIMTKDEYELIEDFIIYHGELIGYKNLVIIDNGSTHPTVLDVYRRYANRINLHYESGFEGMKQSDYMCKYFDMYRSTCKFVLGCDTDEFIYQINGLNILDYLNSLPAEYEIFRIKQYDFSHPDPSAKDFIGYFHRQPARNIKYFDRRHITSIENNDQSKVFFRAETFKWVWLGNHYGNSTNDTQMLVDIGYLHLHDTGKYRYIEKCRNICIAVNKIDSSDNKLHHMKQLEPYILNGYRGLIHNRMYPLYYHLLKEYIIGLYIIYINRYPEQHELNEIIRMNISSDSIETEFRIISNYASEKNKYTLYLDPDIIYKLLYGIPEIATIPNVTENRVVVDFFNNY